MSRNAIFRLVRSVLFHYLGAKLVTKYETFTVVEASNCLFADWEFYQIGSILESHERSLTLRVDDGSIELFFNEPLSKDLRACRLVMRPGSCRNK